MLNAAANLASYQPGSASPDHFFVFSPPLVFTPCMTTDDGTRIALAPLGADL
jgi:hypothetical protein